MQSTNEEEMIGNRDPKDDGYIFSERLVFRKSNYYSTIEIVMNRQEQGRREW